MKTSTLNFNMLCHKSVDSGLFRKKVRESHFVDFTIDGDSLLSAILNCSGWKNTYLGCFSKGWDKLNQHSKEQLLLLAQPETETGRRFLYVCPECADIECGSYGCNITKMRDIYIWSDFAYENGRQEPEVIPSLGPFRFKAEEYRRIIERAYEAVK